MPGCVATWDFGSIAVRKAMELLSSSPEKTAVDVCEEAIKAVEADVQAQYFVGRGGLPNANGEMECDGAIMDADMRYGAVMGIKETVHAVSVARSVMDKCVHNILVGDGALQWALANGFSREKEVLTDSARLEWEAWRDAKKKASSSSEPAPQQQSAEEKGHDTIGFICMDATGALCCGTSTSGWKFKHPGRVGDAPVVGSGLYCDGTVGAAVATGDGEEIMRTCLAHTIVEAMRNGASPQEACVRAIERVQGLKPKFIATGGGVGQAGGELAMHPQLTVGVIAMSKTGEIGSASTVSSTNRHRGREYFPAVCWLESRGPDAITILADPTGATL